METLQDYCDEVESEFPVIIQIKNKTEPYIASDITYSKLVIYAKLTNETVESDWTHYESHLLWWLCGFKQGLMNQHMLTSPTSHQEEKQGD